MRSLLPVFIRLWMGEGQRWHANAANAAKHARAPGTLSGPVPLAAAVVPSDKQSCRTTHEAFTRAPAASDLYDAAQLRER